MEANGREGKERFGVDIMERSQANCQRQGALEREPCRLLIGATGPEEDRWGEVSQTLYVNSKLNQGSIFVTGATKPRISKMLNVQESKKHGCFNTIMNGTAFFLPFHSGSIFSNEICNLDRTKSSFLATSLYKKVIFTQNWVTRSCHPTDVTWAIKKKRKNSWASFILSLNCRKVLKEISCGDLAPDETVGAMHEAKLLSKLHHPNIVKFYDSFLDGEFFCIMYRVLWGKTENDCDWLNVLTQNPLQICLCMYRKSTSILHFEHCN